MILNGGWSTPAVASVGKPATSDLDGPAGINSLVSSLRGVSFPSEAVIGSTWNEALVEEFGRVFGAEALAPGDIAYSGCRNNRAEVTLNGEPVTVEKGQALTVGGEKLLYIANGDVEADSGVLTGNIDAVIAEYGSAVPASFLQKAAILLVDSE